MAERPFTLEDFVRESNMIEGLHRVRDEEIAAHEYFLTRPVLTIMAFEEFVHQVQPGAALRRKSTQNVSVGRYIPPHGGPHIEFELQRIIDDTEATIWQSHADYEALHPFIDGNGRSGRVFWLWMMGGIEEVPLGFLHTWYYQTLTEYPYYRALRINAQENIKWN